MKSILKRKEEKGKRAEWKPLDETLFGKTDTFECSECWSRVFLKHKLARCNYPYCPFCLAEMKGA